MRIGRVRLGTFVPVGKDCGEYMPTFDTPPKARFHPVQLSLMARALLGIAVSCHLYELFWSEADKLGGWLVVVALAKDLRHYPDEPEATRRDGAEST